MKAAILSIPFSGIKTTAKNNTALIKMRTSIFFCFFVMVFSPASLKGEKPGGSSPAA